MCDVILLLGAAAAAAAIVAIFPIPFRTGILPGMRSRAKALGYCARVVCRHHDRPSRRNSRFNNLLFFARIRYIGTDVFRKCFMYRFACVRGRRDRYLCRRPDRGAPVALYLRARTRSFTEDRGTGSDVFSVAECQESPSPRLIDFFFFFPFTRRYYCTALLHIVIDGESAWYARTPNRCCSRPLAGDL